jgi:hypothetical protein
MDIAENSIAAGATKIEITVKEDITENLFYICIKDNGSGMDEATLKKATDPFFTGRTVRRVGLGLPLFKQNAERTGGRFEIKSRPNCGTEVTGCFILDHLDRPPLGDVANTIVIMAAANRSVHFIYTHSTPKGEFVFDTKKIKKVLDGVPMDNPEIFKALIEMIKEEINDI